MGRNKANKSRICEANPELVRIEWHPTKNGKLKPTDFPPHSREKVWWYLPYYDPKTGKHFDFEWQASIQSRSNGSGCPFLSGHAVWKGFNDLATTNPYLASQWHPTKNGQLRSTDVTANSNKVVWWYYPFDDPKTGKHYDFEWEATPNRRSQNCECPFISGEKAWPGYNDFGTFYPSLLSEWHPTKNGDLQPEDISVDSHKRVWWHQLYTDLNTGKEFDFEWKASVYSRIRDAGCPYLSGEEVWPGFNDLPTTHPELAAEWHPTKNWMRKPSEFSSKSHKKVWWRRSFYDEEKDLQYAIGWEDTIYNRSHGKEDILLSRFRKRNKTKTHEK